ncbi:dihydrolipoamide acetyltransferase component of pyruvate dehydrogenase [Lineolata rhizophorae]|uniref:Acetyltransferase component of pyruvate dehydrogenase complex n=1 Tax=Lineolata rhizophorae TaxID=578093 RepID=A0A6A6NXC8_9PEZI|nr:dihydrolipoamide acetyltransferase component of pyruvate dehydrogenase [Lineolata rhizophorae]
MSGGAAAVRARSSGMAALRSSPCLRSSYTAWRPRAADAIPRRTITPALAALARYYASKSFPPHTVISMPALSPTMQAGNIGAWQKKVGDSLNPGDVLVEIETDKAQMDFEFQEEGVLAKILRESGEKDVAIGSPIAVMVEEGEDVSAFSEFTIADAGGDKPPPSEKKEEKPEAPAEEAPSKDTAPSEPAPAISAQESASEGKPLEPSLDREPFVSYAAKKLALEKGVPISQIKGSGPGGIVTLKDVENFKPSAPAAAAGPAAASYEDVPASGMRKTIAARLTQSMRESPHYFVSSSMSVRKLLALRAALNAASNGEYKLSVNDFLVKAMARATTKVPAANASWREDTPGQPYVRMHSACDVSVAVATPAGLMTPIVKNVGGLGLQGISAAVKDLGARARAGKLKPEEYQGGTITISNMGMNDAVERFTAVINPPHASILAVGTVKKVAVPAEAEAEDGEARVEWDDQIVITASFDHRVVDGAVGGEFMREVKMVVENPLELLL